MLFICHIYYRLLQDTGQHNTRRSPCRYFQSWQDKRRKKQQAIDSFDTYYSIMRERETDRQTDPHFITQSAVTYQTDAAKLVLKTIKYVK